MPVVPTQVQLDDEKPRFASWKEWARFRRHTVRTSGCALWVGAVGDDGYGRFWSQPPADEVRSSVVRSSRWLWQAHHGPLAESLVIRHDCDVTLCVRLACLVPGTQSDNLRDAARRDRITNLGRTGKADKRGTAAAARALRQALLNAVIDRGITDPQHLAQILVHVHATGDPYGNQMSLW